MNKIVVQTEDAPQAIGPYSQAIRVGNMVYCSGQIPLDPETMDIVSQDFEKQAEQVFANMKAVVKAAGGQFSDIIKLTIFLTDLTHFPIINATMMKYFQEPYPARSTIQVSALPKGAQVEIEAICVIPA